jgi:endonuclease YncB( thermonuclease family)
VTGGVAPGWYPDYEAPPGHQRYWNGERWTERRSGVPADPPAGVEQNVRRFAPWLLAAVAVLVVVSAAVLVIGDDQTATSNNGSLPPPASSTPGPPASEQTEPDDETETETDRRTWQVDAALDGSTLRLTNGAEVRLVGIADSCGTDVLAKMVVGHLVTLTRRGLEKDDDGTLLRYVERDGADVGKRLIQRGWAKASDEPNARRAIYRRIDERSPDRC